MRVLPDIPRWIETRAMLAKGPRIVGDPEGDFVVVNTSGPLASVVGQPSADVIRAALENVPDDLEIICQVESREHVATALPDWKPIPAVLYTLAKEAVLPATPPDLEVRLLHAPGRSAFADLPPAWKRTLELGGEDSRLAATIVDGVPVAFCTAASTTETLWDAAVITLEAERRKGYAIPCCAHLIRHLWKSGLEPVWGATEDNVGSLRLAARLGFTPVDRLFLFVRNV